MATGEIKTLYSDSEKTKPVFPRTKINAISDIDGTGLHAYLDAIVYANDNETNESTTATINADTLGGVLPENYALKTDIPEFDDTLSIENCIADAKVVGEKFSETTSLVKRVGNPYNLLDNSDFRNPVNQRGQTSYTATGAAQYTIDRWDMNTNVESITLTDSGINIIAKSESHGFFRSYLESKLLFGKTLTFAVKLSNGNIFLCTGTYPSSNPTSQVFVAQMAGTPINIFITAESDKATVQIRINSGGSVTVEWAALYEGEYTLETLPEYQPKGYAHELLECQRYFYKLKAYWKFAYFGICTSTTHADINIRLPIAMRTTPTVTIDDASLIRVKCGSNSSQVPSDITWNACNTATNDSMNMGCTVTNATAGSIAALYFDNGGIIRFSADL